MTFLDQVKTYDQTKQEWLDQWFNKSGSFNSKKLANTSMICYEEFLDSKYPNISKNKIIEELKTVSIHPEKFSQLYAFINDFVSMKLVERRIPQQ